MPLKTRPLGVSPNPLCVVSCQKKLSHRRQVQRRPAPDGAYHLHSRAFTEGAFDIHDLVTLAHTQIDGLLSQLVQFSHRRDGGIPHVEATFDEIAELQQTHA